MVGKACEPWWAKQKLDCPFGTAIKFFDVTVPNNPDFFDGLSIVYGIVPVIAAFFLFFRFCWKRGTQELALGSCLALTVIITEFIIKKQINEMRPGQAIQGEIITKVRQADGSFLHVPRGTCNSSCGMPSSHSVIALTFFVLMVTDVLGTYLLRKHKPLWFFVWMIANTLIYLPVPVSRVVLWDHTSEQVFLGSLIGILTSGFWTFGMQFLNNKFSSKYGQPLLKIGNFVVLVHNLPPSFFHAHTQVQTLEQGALRTTNGEHKARDSATDSEEERKQAMRGTADTTDTTPAEDGAQIDENGIVP